MKKETLDGKIQELVKIDTVAGFPIYLDSKAAMAVGGYQDTANSVDRVGKDILIEKQFDSELEPGNTLKLSNSLQKEASNDLEDSISQLLELQEESEEGSVKEKQFTKSGLGSLNYF